MCPVIDQGCGGISGTMGVKQLFDLDFGLFRCQCGCDLTAGCGIYELPPYLFFVSILLH